MAAKPSFEAGQTKVLPDYVPLATYVALAPFVGAEQACAIARGEGAGSGLTPD